jgi:uncharacterized protein with NRDE domain
MCLILIAIDRHPRYPLVIAANRDEFRSRPTQTAAFWPDASRVLAGRDLAGGGTWLGITATGRFAALTNFREPYRAAPQTPSRGQLVSTFLTGDMDAAGYREFLKLRGETYPGFSLLFGTVDDLHLYSNRGPTPDRLVPGVHGIANHLPGTPWPKVTAGCTALARLLADGEELDPEPFFTLLADRTPPSDDLLPDTGFGLEMERFLAPIFIDGPDYGTLSSTVLFVDRERRVTFRERTHRRTGTGPETVSHDFTLAP